MRRPLLDPYDGWEQYLGALRRATAPLSVEQLPLRAAPHLGSVGELVAHVVAVRARWAHYVLCIGGEECAAFGRWDCPDSLARNAAELVVGLDESWRTIAEALRGWTTDDLTEEVKGEEDGVVVRYTRQWVIWHLIEHDMHHGGEISLSLGVHRLPGIDIEGGNTETAETVAP